MLKISEIREDMAHGDMEVVSEIVGCHVDLVSKVLRGVRNAGSKKGKMVIEVSIALISARKAIKQLVNTNGQDFEPSKKDYWIPIKSN